jgi:hypothetical protein
VPFDEEAERGDEVKHGNLAISMDVAPTIPNIA